MGSFKRSIGDVVDQIFFSAKVATLDLYHSNSSSKSSSLYNSRIALSVTKR